MTTTASRLSQPLVSDRLDGRPGNAIPAPKGSEKRRAQNRAAQKTDREKRKRRLQELEQLAASAGLLDNSTSESNSQSPPESNNAIDPSSASIFELPDKGFSDLSFEAAGLLQPDDLLTQPFATDPSTSELWDSTKSTSTV